MTERNPRRAAGVFWPSAIIATALGSGPFVACVPPDDPDGALQRCEVRADCGDGQVCTQDKLCADCVSSGECRLKEECRIDADAGTQRCGLRSGWGADCERNSECAAGQWCAQGLCRDSTEVRTCEGACPMGDRCNTINFVCEEDLGCVDNADCSSAEVCNLGLNRCVPRCGPETQHQCLPGEQCINEMCVQCASDAECSVGLYCDPAGNCVAKPRCYQDRDCKVPLVCHLQTGTCVDKPPPCASDENCAADQRCYLATGKCIPRSCQPDRFEVNDTFSTARSMTAGAYFDLTLCAGDTDVYAFNLARGDLIGANVEADPFAESTFSTVVQDAFGRTLASGKLLASYVAPGPATYYVSISTTDPYQPYDVTFLVTRGTPCDDDAWEPNDLAIQATPVNLATALDGMICPQDVDHFSVAVPAGKGVRVSLTEYVSSQGLLQLCASADGMELGCSDDPVAPSVTGAAAQVGGKTVAIKVDAADPRLANGYTLAVELL